MKPTRHEENLATYNDDNRRKAAKKAELAVLNPQNRTRPPSPDITLEKAGSFAELAKNLERKAKEFSARGRQSLATRTDQYLRGGDDPETDEVNYGLLETNNRNIAAAIRRILRQ